MTSYWYEHAVTGIRAEYAERFAKVFGDNLIKVDGPAPRETHNEETPRPSRKRTRSSETSNVEVTDNTDSSKEGNE